MEKVFPPSDETYRDIYLSAVPDTLVWRDVLGFNELLTENYLRHPSYADYPVVGVSWTQAVQFCKWRTDRVNEKLLMDKGILNPLFENDSLEVIGKNHSIPIPILQIRITCLKETPLYTEKACLQNVKKMLTVDRSLDVM